VWAHVVARRPHESTEQARGRTCDCAQFRLTVQGAAEDAGVIEDTVGKHTLGPIVIAIGREAVAAETSALALETFR